MKTVKIGTIKIGNVEIKKTAALAPMAGVADRAFREICKSNGAAYLVGEMTSAKGICYNDKKTQKLLYVSQTERPIAVQLFGYEPEYMAKAAEVCLNFCPDIIDINMGCPMRKITDNYSGSALMKEPRLVDEIVDSVVKAAYIPVTVKIRKGWDENFVNAVEIAKIIEAAGASAITIHGRTRQQMYSQNADLDIIRKVKDAVKIPVIGNGDVTDVKSAINMYEQTGCDLVMIGRGALGNPWIFNQIDNYFSTGCMPKEPTILEKIKLMTQHVKLMIEYSTEEIAIKQARKHIAWYVKGFKNAAMLRKSFFDITTFDEFEELINAYMNSVD